MGNRVLCVLLIACVASGCQDDSDSGECGGCLVDGICFPSGVANPANPCEVCDASALADGWSPADGARCDDEVFCNGADACLAGACTAHAGNPCGGGLLCHETEAQCSVDCGGCRIDGVCVLDGQRNPLNECQICDAAAEPDGWTGDDGASCDDGAYCNGADSCQGSVCVSAGDPCGAAEICFEDGGGQCCTPAAGETCDASGDVVELDSCGHELSVVMACSVLGLDCADDHCECDLAEAGQCPSGHRCAFVVDSTPPTVGHAECMADGTALAGDGCVRDSVTGVDNCAAGGVCTEGRCAPTCSRAAQNCAAEHSCVGLTGASDPDVGFCQWQCDVFTQNCAGQDDVCYLLNGDVYRATCQEPQLEPAGQCVATGLLGQQGDCCWFINTCEPGYSCVSLQIPSLQLYGCAYLCDPTDTVGSSDCTTELGAGFHCVPYGVIWEQPGVPGHVGLCVEEAYFGPPSCYNGVQDGAEDGVDCCAYGNASCTCLYGCP